VRGGRGAWARGLRCAGPSGCLAVLAPGGKRANSPSAQTCALLFPPVPALLSCAQAPPSPCAPPTPHHALRRWKSSRPLSDLQARNSDVMWSESLRRALRREAITRCVRDARVGAVGGGSRGAAREGAADRREEPAAPTRAARLVEESPGGIPNQPLARQPRHIPVGMHHRQGVPHTRQVILDASQHQGTAMALDAGANFLRCHPHCTHDAVV